MCRLLLACLTLKYRAAKYNYSSKCSAWRNSFQHCAFKYIQKDTGFFIHLNGGKVSFQPDNLPYQFTVTNTYLDIMHGIFSAPTQHFRILQYSITLLSDNQIRCHVCFCSRHSCNCSKRQFNHMAFCPRSGKCDKQITKVFKIQTEILIDADRS